MKKTNEEKERRQKVIDLVKGEECHVVLSDKGRSFYGSTPHIYGLFYEFLVTIQEMKGFDKKVLDKIYKNANKISSIEMAEMIYKETLKQKLSSMFTNAKK